MSYNQLQTITLNVPLCFYGNNELYSLQAPETISLSLFGYKSDLLLIPMHDLAVHIDGKNLQAGEHHLSVSADTLFLPERIKLLHYSPSPVIITMVKNDQ